jgi:hypothetical protein
VDAGSGANEMVELEAMLGDYIDLEDGKGLTPLTEVNRVTLRSEHFPRCSF